MPAGRIHLVAGKSPFYFYSMFWIIFISALLFIIAWLLLAPVILTLDTDSGTYRVRYFGVASARLVADEELFHIRGRILFIPLRFRPFSPKSHSVKKKRGQKEKKQDSKKRSFSLKSLAGGRNMLRTLHIRRLWLDIDTDDFILNAWLIPLFSALNGPQVQMQVNFEGRAALALDLHTRPGSVLWAMIKTKYQNTFNT